MKEFPEQESLRHDETDESLVDHSMSKETLDEWVGQEVVVKLQFNLEAGRIKGILEKGPGDDDYVVQANDGSGRTLNFNKTQTRRWKTKGGGGPRNIALAEMNG